MAKPNQVVKEVEKNGAVEGAVQPAQVQEVEKNQVQEVEQVESFVSKMVEIYNKGQRDIIFGAAKNKKVLKAGHRSEISEADADKLVLLFPGEIEVFGKKK